MSSWSELADRCKLWVATNPVLLVNLLKEAEMELCTEINLLRYNVNTELSASVSSYAFTNDTQYNLFKYILSVKWQGCRLQQISPDDAPRDNDGALYTGTPTGFWWEDDTVYLNHTTTDSGYLTIDYWGLPKSLTDSSQESPEIPKRFHYKLCDYAIYQAHLKNGDERKAVIFRQEWESNIADVLRVQGSSALPQEIWSEI